MVTCFKKNIVYSATSATAQRRADQYADTDAIKHRLVKRHHVGRSGRGRVYANRLHGDDHTCGDGSKRDSGTVGANSDDIARHADIDTSAETVGEVDRIARSDGGEVFGGGGER